MIDLYTRFAWAVPLKSKKAFSVKEAFEQIFTQSKRKPKRLWVDKGTEFKLMKNSGIEVYHTENDGKAVVIERFNRTLVNKLWKSFTANKNQNWLNILQPTIDNYNNKIHSSIGLSPKKASKFPELIKDITISNNRENEIEYKQSKPKFQVGDRVRIFKYKGTFEKGYKGFWTDEIFEISEILNTFPRTYRINDLNNEPIIGSFYENELQKTLF